MIIIGKGGFAREVNCYLGSRGNDLLTSDEFLKCDPSLRELVVIIAIGDGSVRKKIAEENLDIFCWGVVNHGVQYGQNDINDGTIICPGTILTTDIWIGRHVIINLNCTIGHDVKIGDYTTISPGANISGDVKIGDLCYIGTNAVIREKINICDKVVIGAGAVVVKDITEPGVYVGNPCKKIN